MPDVAPVTSIFFFIFSFIVLVRICGNFILFFPASHSRFAKEPDAAMLIRLTIQFKVIVVF